MSAIRRALAEIEAEHAAEQAEFEARPKAREDYEQRTGCTPVGRPPTQSGPDEQTLFARQRT